MAINTTDNTVSIIQELIHDAFDTNGVLDRIKSVVSTKLICPIISNEIHMLAHNYAIAIGDGLGDLIEPYNKSVKYGNIESHVEDCFNLSSAIEKVYDTVITYQNELNVAYREILNNGDIHILVGLSNIIDTHNKYVEKVILMKDVIEKYGNDPRVDVNMKSYV